jgi:energy-coupling factor transport system permease protein
MTSSEHSLRFVNRKSVIHRIYPLIKLAWVFIVAIGMFFYKTPASGAILLVVIFLLALILARIPLRNIVGSAAAIFGLGILLMIFHFFADPGTPVLHIGPLAITDVGLREGPIFFFRLSVVVLSSFVLIWTTDIRDLMVSLTKAGMPYKYAFAIFLSLRFLPLIQREVDAVKAAHAIRGSGAGIGIGRRFRLWQRYMFTVLINGLRKAEATAVAIECRGFGAYPDRTYVKSVEFKPAGLLLIVVSLVVMSTLLVVERAL